jgi:hydrogenase maturation protease
MRNALREDPVGLNATALVIGIGNEFRSDDGLGVLAAREIRRRALPGVRVIEESGEGTSLLESWQGYPYVVLIDAVSSGASAGEVHRIDCIASPVPRTLFRGSSHAFGVADAVALGRNLGTLPGVLLLYGIEGCRFDTGTGLSDNVIRSMPQLLGLIEADIEHAGHLTVPA